MVEVILMSKVENLGKLGDKVRVRPGFARNYLIPYGKAKYATKENLAAFAQERAALEAKAQAAFSQAQARAESLRDLIVVIRARAGSEGKLFGSVGAKDIAESLTSAGFPTERREVRLADAIRHAGEFQVELHLHPDVQITVTVQVEADIAAEGR
jgi:large subunit ribosomal protein L9